MTRSVRVSLGWSVGLVFQGGFMVFNGFWFVSMVFQGGFMVLHGFWLVSMVFQYDLCLCVCNEKSSLPPVILLYHLNHP